MAKKPPQRPEEIYAELLEDLTTELGTDLVSVCLFGSAAAGRYVKGSSDLNLLIVVSQGSHRVISRLTPFYKKWAPAGLAPPLLMTPEYIESSLDVFPIEFLVMAASHKCLFGEDPLVGLDLEPSHLRLQLEREMKGKLAALRTRLLASGGEPRELAALTAEALPAFRALFQAWLHLISGGFPSGPDEVLEAMANRGFEVQAFLDLTRVRQGHYKPKASELVGLWEKCIEQVEEICRQVDRLEV